MQRTRLQPFTVLPTRRPIAFRTLLHILRVNQPKNSDLKIQSWFQINNSVTYNIRHKETVRFPPVAVWGRQQRAARKRLHRQHSNLVPHTRTGRAPLTHTPKTTSSTSNTLKMYTRNLLWTPYKRPCAPSSRSSDAQWSSKTPACKWNISVRTVSHKRRIHSPWFTIKCTLGMKHNNCICMLKVFIVDQTRYTSEQIEISGMPHERQGGKKRQKSAV